MHMTERELQKLKKEELLEILQEQNSQIKELQDELEQAKKEDANRKNTSFKTFRSAVSILIVVAAVSILVATFLLPVLRIYGSSMTPTLKEGEIVVSIKGSNMNRGDIVAFYYNNKVLVKRVIAFPGEWVDIDDRGYVTVDGKEIEEDYLGDRAFGNLDITLPYQVPEGRYFVMGDHRSTSIDSRNTTVGCIAEEQIIGRLVFRVWPLDKIGNINR